MAVWTRMKSIVAADVHDWLDKAEDPVQMTKLHIRELEEEMEKTLAALAEQWAAERQMTALILDTETLAKKRARQAELAVERCADAMAELAVREKIVGERRLEAYRSQLETIRANARTLSEQLQRLKDTHAELRFKLSAIAARLRAAASIERAGAAIASYDFEKARRDLDRLEAKAWHAEARAEARSKAHAMLSGGAPCSPEDELGEEVQAELARLKAQRAAQ